jgi:alkyl hydroperoxide reductase 1
VAVNDPYVMAAWGEAQGVGDRILMLADSAGELTHRLGLERDLSGSGLGIRCRRFAALLEDGVFRHVAVEPGPGITVCGATHLLGALAASAGEGR